MEDGLMKYQDKVCVPRQKVTEIMQLAHEWKIYSY